MVLFIHQNLGHKFSHNTLTGILTFWQLICKPVSRGKQKVYKGVEHLINTVSSTGKLFNVTDLSSKESINVAYDSIYAWHLFKWTITVFLFVLM